MARFARDSVAAASSQADRDEAATAPRAPSLPAAHFLGVRGSPRRCCAPHGAGGTLVSAAAARKYPGRVRTVTSVFATVTLISWNPAVCSDAGR